MNFKYHERTGASYGFCLVKSVEKKTNKNGGVYLDFVLSDKSGEIPGKLWNYDEDIHGFFEPNMLIKVQGVISQFNGADQIKIERIRPAIEADQLNIDDFVPAASYSGTDMFNELVSIVESFSDEDIKKLVLTMLNENKEKLLFFPAAFKLHHAMRGGLLFHTLSIVRLAQSVCSIYPFVDGDLLIGGAVLHDIAKLSELEAGDTGIVTSYSVEGTLLGHLVMGAMMVDKAAERLGIDHEKAMLIEHMLISHHGDPEFGAAVRPLFLEADILAALDRLDSRIAEVNGAVAGVDVGKFSPKQWALDNRSFYNHGRADATLTAELGIESDK